MFETVNEAAVTMTNEELKIKPRKISKMRKPRLVDKNGNLNIVQRNASRRAKSYIMDIFITMVDTKWRYIFLVFMLGFVCSWLLFACFYFTVSHVHEDFQTSPGTNETFPCVENVDDFITMLLFSFETQTTIGYGSRYVTDECVPSMIGVLLQSICGVLLQAFLTGIILSKFQKPKRRAQTILFSKTACISVDGHDHFLSIRVGDIQKSQLMDICVRAICVTENMADDRKTDSKFCYELDFTRSKNKEKIHLFWPIILYHKITPESPFWKLEQTTLSSTELEVIVILEGTSESTGTVVQARRSYTQNEILWGDTFKTMTLLSKNSTQHDYKQFHSTVPVKEMRQCSAECSAYGKSDVQWRDN